MSAEELLGDISSIPPEEISKLRRIFQLASQVTSAATKWKQKQEIVPIREWVNSDYYLGNHEAVYPFWKESLCECFEYPNKYNEIVVEGGFGIGKSAFSELAIIRFIYELSCFDNLPSKFNMFDDHFITLFYFSVTRETAESTGYGNIRNRIDGIPYFQKEFPRDKSINSRVIWPEARIQLMSGSQASHSIGLHVILAAMDEANFSGGDTEGRNDVRALSKASHLFNNARSRSKSRFMTGGIDYSMAMVVSSPTGDASFTEERKLAALEDPKIKVVTGKIWDTKPRGTYGTERFWVFKGSSTMDPKVMESMEDINEFADSMDLQRYELNSNPYLTIKSMTPELKYHFMEVPVEFLKEFKANVIMALRDLGGLSTAPVGRLFTGRPIYAKLMKEGEDLGLRHPFDSLEITLPSGSPDTIQKHLRPGFYLRKPRLPRFVHVDLAETTDAAGIAMCYIDRVEEVDGALIPYIVEDFALRIPPPANPRRTSISRIREFFFWLRETYSVDFGMISYDQFQSSESLQIIDEAGIPCKKLSVDRTDGAYLDFVNLLLEGRFHSYAYKPFEKEFFLLIHDRERGKVDHPPGLRENGERHGKDVSDARVGAVANALASDISLSVDSGIVNAFVASQMDDIDVLFSELDLY